MLTTCGDQSDPRIRLNVDIADALTFVFKSDGNNPQQYRGVNITIIEINSTAANVSDNVHFLLAVHNVHINIVVW